MTDKPQVKAYVHERDKQTIRTICNVLGYKESELIALCILNPMKYIKLLNMNLDSLGQYFPNLKFKMD